MAPQVLTSVANFLKLKPELPQWVLISGSAPGFRRISRRRPFPAPFQLCLPLTALTARTFSVGLAGDVGGSGGGAKMGMKGPFSSTAGRTAATKARLDTLCPEPPLQLVSPSRSPCSFSPHFSPSSAWLLSRPWNSPRRGSFVTEARGSDRTAEGQGQPPPSVLSWTPLSSPGSSGRRN